MKQGYGVLISLSVKKAIFYSEIEKKIFLINGYVVWITTWVFSNGIMARAADTYLNIPYMEIVFPFEMTWLVFVSVALSALTIGIFVLRADQGRVSWNGWTGYFCALYVWTAIILLNPLFIIVIPALHSLQYLLFVGKMSFERHRVIDASVKSYGFVVFLTIGGILGVLGFWAVPLLLDSTVPYDREIFGSSMFLMMFLVFINIHHYFIDFAIWRKDNAEMKYLYQ